MTMNEKDFLNLLTRVVKLSKEVAIFNTNFMRFSYSLEEKKGILTLIMSFPSPRHEVKVCYDSNCAEEAYKILDEVERYIKEKREYIETSRFRL